MKALRYSLTLLLLAVMVAVLVPLPAAAQFNNGGTSAANFLKIPVGPRGTALGGAFSARVDDASSLYWNVAGMTGVANHEVSFATNLWLLDLRHDFVAGVFSLGAYNRIGLSVSYLSMGTLEVTTPDRPTGTGLEFTAYDVALGLAYARQVTDRLSVGAQSKFIREAISQSSASGLAFDLGLIYTSAWNDLRIGATIANFGPNMTISGSDLRQTADPHPDTGSNPDDVPLFLETESFTLPIMFQVGASVTPMRTESMAFTAMLDVRDARDFNQELRVGGELVIMNTLALRAGTNFILIEGSPFGGGDEVVIEGRDDADNSNIGTGYTNPTTITRRDLRDGQALFNVGAGLKAFLPGSRTGFKFDYAFSRIQTLDDAHRFSLSLTF